MVLMNFRNEISGRFHRYLSIFFLRASVSNLYIFKTYLEKKMFISYYASFLSVPSYAQMSSGPCIFRWRVTLKNVGVC